jgi:hypothetical protein
LPGRGVLAAAAIARYISPANLPGHGALTATTVKIIRTKTPQANNVPIYRASTQ